MKMTLKGDYFDGEFTHVSGVKLDGADEVINKTCPAETDLELWQAPVFYSNISKVIESAQHGFEVWRKTDLNSRIEVLKKFREVCFKRRSFYLF